MTRLRHRNSVSAVIVSFNSGDHLGECLASLPASAGPFDMDVVVVDNASSDNSTERVEAAAGAARLIRRSSNGGFAVASNQGIAECRGDYVLLLNPDVVAAEGAVAELVEFAERNPEAGAVGGQLRNTEGTLQQSIRRFPTLPNQLGEALFLHKIFKRSRLFAELVSDPRAYEGAHRVDWVSGAVLLLRRKMLESTGLLDERFFLYSEDADLCLRIGAAGWHVYYCPDALFTHHHGESGTDPDLYGLLVQSRLRFYKKHYGRVRSGLLGLTLIMHVGLRACVWSALAVVSRRDRTEGKRSNPQVYWKGLARAFADIRVAGGVD